MVDQPVFPKLTATMTDGALRMLVLLHFYRLGYSSVTLADRKSVV